MTDKSITDLNRRELNLKDKVNVKEVLPEYFRDEFPKIINFLEKYYEHECSADNPARLIHDLFTSRDITQTDINLLTYIEDELLLGQQFFEGFDDKRAAAKYSNTLYRSKGSLYSIEQFFRTFYSISPDVIYTKNNMFIIGESEIGPESQKYIIDDKLYQTYAILIKASIPISKWKDAYKTFVHPAGMYIGGEVQIVSSVSIDLLDQPDAIPVENADRVIQTDPVPALEYVAVSDITSLIDVSGSTIRVSPDRALSYYDVPITELDPYYDSVKDFMEATSDTYDEDADSDTSRYMRISSGRETHDKDKHEP